MKTEKFKVWWPEIGQTQEDSKTWVGVDHRQVARIWADWYDYYSADYLIVGGQNAEVQVLKEGDTEPVTVHVSGWTSREYTAA